jgi:hypothetical protein
LHLASEHVVDKKVDVGWERSLGLSRLPLNQVANAVLHSSDLIFSYAELKQKAVAEKNLVAGLAHRLDVLALAVRRARSLIERSN